MSEPVKTALFGGTFNPIHNGHIAIAKSIIEQKLADELWLMVTPCNPWKKGKQLLDDQLRYRMACDAVEGLDGIMASDYEFKLPIPSYSADTLRHITSDYPERRFILTPEIQPVRVKGQVVAGGDIVREAVLRRVRFAGSFDAV